MDISSALHDLQKIFPNREKIYSDGRIIEIGGDIITEKCSHQLVRYSKSEDKLYYPYGLMIDEDTGYLMPIDSIGQITNFWDLYEVKEKPTINDMKKACYRILELYKELQLKNKLEKIEKDFK
jgi:hypothetical protein